MLGGKLVEGEQHLFLVGYLGHRARPLCPNSPAKRSTAFKASVLFSASVISWIAFLALRCTLFGRESSTFEVL